MPPEPPTQPLVEELLRHIRYLRGAELERIRGTGQDSPPELEDEETSEVLSGENQAQQGQSTALEVAGLRKERIADRQSDRQIRESLSDRMFWAVIGWLIAIYALVVTDGAIPGFNPDDFTVRLLVGSTSTALFGAFGATLRSLFSRRRSARKD